MGGVLHLVQRGGDWAGLQPAKAPLLCTKYILLYVFGTEKRGPPINGQCTNFILFDVVL